MNRRRYVALTSALLAGSISGCVSQATPRDIDAERQSTPAVEPDTDDEDLATLVDGTNALAFDLFKELRSDDDAGNVLASPVSVTTALAMTYAGARGDTRDQMRKTLNYTLDDETLHGAFNTLDRSLTERDEDVDDEDLPEDFDTDGESPVPFQLNLVNSIWGQEGFPFRDEFLTTLADHYGGGLNEVDFTDDPSAVREAINDWVAAETDDRIDELLPKNSLTAQTVLVLTNAIYFMANWRHPFGEELTTDTEFTALGGSLTQVPMMAQQERVPAAEVDGVQVVDLPYVGEDVSMLVVVPPEGEFEAYESGFDATTLEQLVDALEPQSGYIRLPQFAFESSFELETALSAMGMPAAFSRSTADFSGMVDPSQTSGGLYLDEVYHDTHIAVDENGTEAAAATASVMMAVSAPPTLLTADRPFLFAIRDRPTGTVLFLGRVVDAGAAQA